MKDKVGKRSISRKKGRREGGKEGGREEEKGNLRIEQKDSYKAS